MKEAAKLQASGYESHAATTTDNTLEANLNREVDKIADDRPQSDAKVDSNEGTNISDARKRSLFFSKNINEEPVDVTSIMAERKASEESINEKFLSMSYENPSNPVFETGHKGGVYAKTIRKPPVPKPRTD